MSRHAAVRRLSPEVRAELDALARDERNTLNVALAWLAEKGNGNAGLSRSALGRYFHKLRSLPPLTAPQQEQASALLKEVRRLRAQEDELMGKLVDVLKNEGRG